VIGIKSKKWQGEKQNKQGKARQKTQKAGSKGKKKTTISKPNVP